MYSAVFLSYDIVWWNSTVCLRGHKLVACGNTISYTIFGKNNGYKKLDIWPDAVPSIFDFGPTASKSNTGKSSKTSTALFKPMGTGWGSMGRGKWIKFDKKKSQQLSNGRVEVTQVSDLAHGPLDFMYCSFAKIICFSVTSIRYIPDRSFYFYVYLQKGPLIKSI